MTQLARRWVRWMIGCDLPQVLRIEAESFESPWTEKDFRECIKRHNPSCVGMVVEEYKLVVGYMLYDLHKEMIRVVNFAVHPDRRRFGVGTSMIDTLKAKLSQQRRNAILIDVRERNLPAQLFLKSQGFKLTAAFRGAYEDTGEDCYLMKFSLADEVDYWRIADGEAEVIEGDNGVRPAVEPVE